MAEYTLHGFAQSGNAYKPALMLNLCGADWTPKFTDYFGGETRTPEFRANVNVMGEVPVLEHKGRKLGGRPTIADISICGYLYFPDEFGVKWDSEFPNIAKWLARISALKGWKHPYQMLPGHPLPGKK